MAAARRRDQPRPRATALSTANPLASGDDPREVSRHISEAHDRFLATGRAGALVRPVVADSWLRCIEAGLDPERIMAPLNVPTPLVDSWQQAHPLSATLPIIRKLLLQDATDAGLLVALTDAAGRLLWVEGEHRLRSRAESMNFVAGADWSEASAGTNAPGTSLMTGRPVQIFAAEHLARRATPWSCAAAPIHDPDTGAIMGALDLTGGDDVAAPRSLSLVRATVAAVESELRIQRLLSREPESAWPGTAAAQAVEVQALGRHSALFRGRSASIQLSRRHSELLVLLTAHPEGLGGEQIEALIHPRQTAEVTVRAELSRLRNVLMPSILLSRPYRLAEPVAADWARVTHLATSGQVGAAVGLYRGPLLPSSDAPEITRLRTEVHQTLRRALISSGDPDAILRFGDTEHGRDDWEIWMAALSSLPKNSSRRAQVVSHLEHLDEYLR